MLDCACGACKVILDEKKTSALLGKMKRLLETMAAEDDERLACQCKVYGDKT